MHSTCITMRVSVVFLGLLALTAAIPTSPKLQGANQELLQKQQDVIHLLENIVGTLPYEHLLELGMTYEFEPNLQNYQNPSVVKYFVGLVKTGHVQPKGTPYSVSVSVLRKEAALLSQILMGAKDYPTFLATAAWARVHINQDQFVKAFSSAVLQRQDLQGVILPPPYEVYPHYFFDTRIIQKVQDYINKYGLDYQGQNVQGQHNVHHIQVNYTSTLPFGENQIAYLTEDIGLSAYYSYVHLASYMLPSGVLGQKSQGGYQQQHGIDEGLVDQIGHGANFYYIHQQLLARYNLERIGQGLGPIKELDSYYEHIETPFKPHLRYVNGIEFPGREEHIVITPRHHNYELVKLVSVLEQRIIDAIDSGHVITPQGAFLSLYQPQGLNILGELIEGAGRSINPRYYGSLLAVSKNLLGNVPEFNNIWEYSPSALELGQTCVRDPIFYQLFDKILNLFHYYQEALPAYQYNDIVVPGVKIEKIDVSDLITYFSDYEVDLSNAVPQPVGLHTENQPLPHVKAQLKRLDHKQYEYTINVAAEKAVPGAVVRVYVGPKYNYDGQPIDINVHRHYFFELDQFVYDLTEGHNVIVRNSHQATGQSYDWPSVQQIKEHVDGAIRSQNPYYITYPQQLYGFPARLSLPKGSQSGYPLQMFVIITSGVQRQGEQYGPIIEEEWMTYQPQHYQIVGDEEYEQFNKLPVDKIHGGYQTIEVIPDFDGQLITEGVWHWGYLYKKYPGSYAYPHWQQTYYHNVHHESHGSENLEGEYMGSQHLGGQQQGGIMGGVMGGQAGIVGGVMGGQASIVGGVMGGQAGIVGGVMGGQGGIVGGVNYGQGLHKQQGYHHQQQQNMLPGGLHVQGGQNYGVNTGLKKNMGLGVNQMNVPEVHGGQYYGSGHYPGVSEYQGQYPSGVYQGWKGHEEQLHNYYQNKHIGDIIGGAVSLDGKPLGYPLDRQLAHSAFYAPNIYIKDVVVYHLDEYISEY